MPSPMPSRRRLLGGLLALASAGFAAEEPVELDPVDVVATPLAGLPVADRYGAAVTTIGPDQLRDLQPLDFASALRRSPGVTITRYNQVGAFGGSEGGAVFLRGLGLSRPGGEIKTTFDGVPKLNGIFNHPLLDLLSLDAAAAIHIHHRATPLAFANTFGAVDIESPRVDGPGARLRASVAGGSFGTFAQSLAYGAKRGGTDYYVAQGYRASDGARPDAAGRLTNVFLRVGQDLGEHWNLSYRVNRGDNRTTDPGILGAPPGPPSTRGETYATSDWLHLAVLEWSFPATSGSLRAYLNEGEGDWTRRPFSGNADSLNDWRLHGVRWRQTVRLGEGGEVLVGADVDVERGTSVSVPPTGARVVFGPDTTRLVSPYAGWSHEVAAGGWRVTPSVGVRRYRHDALGSRWSPQAGLRAVAGGTELRAGFSRAVNYPGLEVRALSTFNAALGTSWRGLEPEEAEQAELAWRQDLGGGAVVGVTLFRNDVSGRYVIVPPPPPPPRYANVGAYRTEGVEVAAEYAAAAGLKLFAGATLLRADPAGLPYVPERTFNAGLNWSPLPGWQVSVDAAYVSAMRIASLGRSSTAANPRSVGAQAAVNARLARRFAVGPGGRTRLEVFVAGENLTDRDFAYNPGYPIPGLNGLVGLRLER
jgi:outer membrane cobalamin receptor